jgi:CDP-diacylglycerol--glycerol-3-phosphate 3-phosphatidyltransferase
MAYGIGRVLAVIRVKPTAVTVAGLVLNIGVPLAALLSGAWLAAGLLLLASVADTVDGAIAVLTRRTTRLGFLYDALADRLAEVCWLTAFWVLGAPVPLLVICGAVAWLHEYTRARAVAVGLTAVASMTSGERTARLVVAISGLVLAGVTGVLLDGIVAGTVTVAAVIWLFLGLFGLAQLLSAIRAAFR